MLSHKDHELQDVHEDLAAARSKTECDEYECATLQEEVSRKAHELQDVHEELIAVKSSNEKIKEERDQYEDAQLDLQDKVQELEQCNRRLEETVCRDESHLTLVRDQGRLKAQLTILEDAHRKVLAEKHQLQISHECLAKALEQLTPQLEEEKKEFERKQRKQEKYFRDKRDKLRLGEAELKEGFQRVEVEKTKFQVNLQSETEN
jgi:chromosome segregation ATPase